MRSRVAAKPASSSSASRDLAHFVGMHLPDALAAARRAARAAGVHDDDLVHEAAHAGVTEAWRAVEGRESQWPARIAVRTIAQRRALDLLRRRRARARRETALGGRDTRDEAPGPRDQAEAEEVRSRVREAIDALPPDERRWVEALVAHEGPTGAALALGMPKSSFRSRIERVCDALRWRLRSLATAGVLVAIGAAALAPATHPSTGPFAFRSERPATSALLTRLRAEAAHYRGVAASDRPAPPAHDAAHDVQTRRWGGCREELASTHVGRAFASAI